MRDPNDALGRSRCIKQIGMVHYERFRGARRQDGPQETLLKHAQAAEKHYWQALDLCPATAITDLGPLHQALGSLYAEIGPTERAREHFEQHVQICEQTGNRYSAGQTRYNMAVIYLQAAGQEGTAARQRDLFLRAQAYAQAALRDFQDYKDHAAADETDTQKLLDAIGQFLAKLAE